MNAHIITIGDEILIGQTMNTNAAYIGEELTKIEVNVRSTSVVGDDEEAIISEFRRCLSFSDILIVTGGLGPTHDDLTLPCIVKFFNMELEKNAEVLEDIKKIFERRGRELTKTNESQAMVPRGASVIRNQLGTAPGVWIEKNGKVFTAIPGVPQEMAAMMSSFVIPRLKEMMGEPDVRVKMKTLLTTGIAESMLYDKLGDINELLDGAKLAFLPSQYGVKLRITVKEAGEEEAKNKLLEIEQKIRSKAGRYIYGNEGEQLEEVVGRLLKERGLTLSVAESCTGGLLAHMITNVNGSSSYFERGIVSYSNGSKVELLKVDEDDIAKFGAVSLETARAMAEGIRGISGTDIGLSVTGIMGPTGAATGKPVGLVYIGICDDKICTAKRFVFGEDRMLNKQRTAQAALDILRKYLLGISTDD